LLLGWVQEEAMWLVVVRCSSAWYERGEEGKEIDVRKEKAGCRVRMIGEEEEDVFRGDLEL
jgi:hypothetical protein